MIGFGLIAGLTLQETLASTPGFILDIYLMRRKYDDAQHGITRKQADEGGANA